MFLYTCLSRIATIEQSDWARKNGEIKYFGEFRVKNISINMEKYKQLKNKILKVCPDIECRNTSVMMNKPFSGLINHRDDKIRFADILLVLEKCEIDISFRFYFPHSIQFERNGKLLCIYNLEKNSLEEQKEKTKEDLFNLICKTHYN